MKAKRNIVVTRDDYERLQSLLDSDFSCAFSDKPYLQSLRGELDAATIVDTEDVPPNVVTMNSVVRLLEAGSQEVGVFTLVYPEDANIAKGKLSVLAPIGIAILGYQVGDTASWQVPDGTVKLLIEEMLFQPERDGVVA